jgi:hypothetical protein
MIALLLFALLITVSYQTPLRGNKLFKRAVEKDKNFKMIPRSGVIDPEKVFLLELLDDELEELKERIDKNEKEKDDKETVKNFLSTRKDYMFLL